MYIETDFSNRIEIFIKQNKLNFKIYILINKLISRNR